MFHFKAENWVNRNGSCTGQLSEKLGDKEFSCALEARRCAFTRESDNRQCKRITRKQLPYCWQHMRSVYHVVIKKSGLSGAGLGLFACDSSKPKNAVIFKKGDYIVAYAVHNIKGAQNIGENLSKDELTKRYGVCVAGTYTIDSKKAGKGAFDTACQRSVASYANTDKSRNNARAAYYIDEPGEIFLEATDNILNNTEIFWDYGDKYWRGKKKKLNVREWHTGRSEHSQKCKTARN